MGLGDLLSGDTAKFLDGQFGKRLEAATTEVAKLAEVSGALMEVNRDLMRAVKGLDQTMKTLVEEIRKT